jgi:predicted ATPase
MVDSLGQGSQGVLMVDFFRLRGELLLAVSMENAAEAENGLKNALGIALEQGANMLALRTAISLCHVWQKQGKFEESRQLMREVYPRMTEGFSMPDLQEARAILEESV